MFDRYVYILILVNMAQPKLRYLGVTSSLLSLELLREAYMMAAVYLKKAQDGQPNEFLKEVGWRLNPAESSQEKSFWGCKVYFNFHIFKVINDKEFDLLNSSMHACQAIVADIQLLLPAEYNINFLHDAKAFYTACKYINAPGLMDNL